MKLRKTMKALLAASAASVMMMAVMITAGAEEAPVENEVPVLDDNNEWTDADNGITYKFTVTKAPAVLNKVTCLDGTTGIAVVPGEVVTNKGDTLTVGGNLSGCFVNNTAITSIDLSATAITLIQNGGGSRTGFIGCENLQEVIFPDTLTNIQNYTFKNCRSLEYIRIPASVASIGSMPGTHTFAFENCDSLKAFDVAAGSARFTAVDGVLYSADTRCLMAYPNAKEGTEYTVPDSVTEIAAGAFQTAVNLERVTLPASVQKINQLAFCGENPSFTSAGTKNSIGQITLWGSPAVVTTYPTFTNGMTIIQKAVSVKVLSDTDSCCPGDTVSFKAAVLPEGEPNSIAGGNWQQDTSVTWSVDNDTIASIDSDGVLTAKKGGKVTVTAATNDGSKKSASAELEIQVPAEAVEITEKNGCEDVNVDEFLEFSAKVLPENASDQDVEWTVCAEDGGEMTAAEIDANGVLAAMEPGTVIVKAVNHGGNPKVNGGLVVGEYRVVIQVPAESVTVTADKDELTAGDTLKLSAVVEPEECTYQDLVWSVDNGKAAEIAQDGTLTAKAAGNVTVTASVMNGEVSGTFELTIKEKETEPEETEPETQPTTEPETQPTTEPTTEPETEPETEPTTETEPETQPETVPEQIRATKQTTTSISLTWPKDQSAKAGYRIYVKGGTAGKYTKVADVKASKTSYSLKKIKGRKLKSGTAYQVRVVSLSKKGKKTVEGRKITLKAATSPSKVKVTSAKKVKKGTVKLQWKKVNGTSGYQIQMKKSAKGSYQTVKTAGKSTKSFTKSGLGRKKTIYLRIRAYKNVNGARVYGAWVTKKVRI